MGIGQWGAFAGGLAQGIQSGSQLANAAELRKRSEQDREIRGYGLGRAKQEDADMQAIKDAQMEVASTMKDADPETVALATTSAAMRRANELGRADLATSFYAANTTMKAGVAKKSIDTALRLQDPTYIGKALSVLTDTKMDVSMNPDGSMTLNDGANKQDIPRDSVAGFISNLADPNAAIKMSHDLFLEANKAKLKNQGTLFEKQLEHTAKLGEIEATGAQKLTEIGATGAQARLTEKTKYRDPKDNYMTVPENSSLVDVRSGQTVEGGAGGPPTSFTPDLQRRASEMEKDLRSDMGTSEVDENGYVTHRHSPASEQASILASKLLLGSATGKKDVELSNAELKSIAKDVVANGDKSKYQYREGLIRDGNRIYKVPMVVGGGKQLTVGRDREDVTDQFEMDGTPKAKKESGLGAAAVPVSQSASQSPIGGVPPPNPIRDLKAPSPVPSTAATARHSKPTSVMEMLGLGRAPGSAARHGQ